MLTFQTNQIVIDFTRSRVESVDYKISQVELLEHVARTPEAT